MVIASAWGVIKFIKPLIDHFTPKTPPPAASTDAVVISAALADSKSIHELTQKIDKLCEVQEKGNIINQMLYEAVTRLTLKS